MTRFSRYVASLAAVVLIASCSTVANLLLPDDPLTAPPPTITSPTIATSGSVSIVDPSAGVLEINVAGFVDSLGNPVTGLATDDFVVVEDGVVQGIIVGAIGGSTTAAADIVFVFDTTASMGGALTSVKDSINGFATLLDSKGLDVRFGAVTFGDAFDTLSVGSTWPGASGSTTPPSFDLDDRPIFDLSTSATAFEAFIDTAFATGGAGSAENAVGALAFAYDEMNWRDGAQKIMIVVMDPYGYDDTNYSEDSITGRWIPEDPDGLLARLQGNATVHAVTPDYPSGAGSYVDMAMFTGLSGTGGVHVPWTTASAAFDLSDVEIAEVSGGYVITYAGDVDGTLHTVRVVIDDGGSIRGEFTINVTY